jgi:hypothetical protein
MNGVEVPKEEVKDHLDWVRQLIAICAAALGALIYKFDDSHPTPWQIKASATCFVGAMLLLFIAYVGLVNHQSRADVRLRTRAALPFFLGWALFILAFVFAMLRFLLSP